MLVAATSPTASMKAPATLDVAPSSSKKSKTHPESASRPLSGFW
jgi:hypothetical protein